jgi:hypothetical protein
MVGEYAAGTTAAELGSNPSLKSGTASLNGHGDPTWRCGNLANYFDLKKSRRVEG